MSRLKALAVVVPAALALIAGAATASSTSVTITSPKEGQSFSQKRVPNLPVYGGVTFAAANTTTSLFYVRRDGAALPATTRTSASRPAPTPAAAAAR